MMLVPFALEPEAIEVDENVSADILAAHHRFLCTWISAGVLVRPDGDQDGMMRLISRLPQRFRTRWQKAMKVARTSLGPKGWPGLTGVETPDELSPLKGEVSVALIDDVTAFVAFDIPDEAPGKMLARLGIEACKFRCSDLATSFEDMMTLASSDILQGERIINVWQARFAPLARSSRSLVIVDRYALTDGPSWGGTERFLRELDGTGKRVNVTLISAIFEQGGEDAASQTLVHLRQQLCRGGVGEIQLYCVNDRDFSKSHDRYVRFDHTVCELGEGLSVLGSNDGKVYRDCSFNAKLVTDGKRERERRLKQQSVAGCPFLI